MVSLKLRYFYSIVNNMDYFTDTGGSEMDQTQNGEVIIGPQLDPNIALQDADMEEDEARSETTFRFTVSNFSKLKVYFQFHCHAKHLLKVI